MTQVIQGINLVMSNNSEIKAERTEYGARNNSYSFVIPPRSIQRENCSFYYSVHLHETQSNQFDEIRFMYYDEKDKEHIFSIRRIAKCWHCAGLIPDDDWIQAK